MNCVAFCSSEISREKFGEPGPWFLNVELSFATLFPQGRAARCLSTYKSSSRSRLYCVTLRLAWQASSTRTASHTSASTTRPPWGVSAPGLLPWRPPPTTRNSPGSNYSRYRAHLQSLAKVLGHFAKFRHLLDELRAKAKKDAVSQIPALPINVDRVWPTLCRGEVGRCTWGWDTPKFGQMYCVSSLIVGMSWANSIKQCILQVRSVFLHIKNTLWCKTMAIYCC